MSKLDDLKPISELARIVGMNRQRLRDLCVKAHIAVRWGGNEKHPRLRAKLADVERVILNNKLEPAATPARQAKRKPAASTVHHLVTC